MKPPYIHPSLDQRREPFRLSSAKILMLVIAQRLNRHPSTLYREIKPNWFHDEEPLYRYPLHFGSTPHRGILAVQSLEPDRNVTHRLRKAGFRLRGSIGHLPFYCQGLQPQALPLHE